MTNYKMKNEQGKLNGQRNTSIELMRLLSMIMIVIHHIVGQGIGFQFYCTGGGGSIDFVHDWRTIIFIESLCIVGVNLFLLISGYYGIKLKMKGLVKYLAVVWGFVLLHSLLESFYTNTSTIHILRSLLFFYSENTAWFVKSYFILMLLTFLINPALSLMNKRQLLSLLGIVLYINIYLGFFKHWTINENGYTVSHMVMMYIIGHTINQYDIPTVLRKRYLLLIYLLLSVFGGIIMCLFLDRIDNKIEFWLLSYNNPIIICSSIALFCFFVRYRFYNKKLNYILSGTFGIYLLHQFRPFWTLVMIPIIRENFTCHSTEAFILYCIMLITIIMASGIIINLLIFRLVDLLFKNQRCQIIFNKIEKNIGL